ncbi:TPA: YjdF family protein, partial [Streptococcus agalactiae]
MKMTVYFDGNFWLGLIEYDDDGDYKVFRYFFGKEPKDDDVFNFINHKLNDLIKKYE